MEELEAEVRRLRGRSNHDGGISHVEFSSVDAATSADESCPVNPRRHRQRTDMISQLSSDEVTRYSRQLLLADGFGVAGQKRLLSSSVLVVGAGGIGSTVLPYLAAAGVGKITVVDFDGVDRSNLHRQIIHDDASVGRNKAESACGSLRALNPTITCVAVSEALTADNALRLVAAHDAIVDASDNPKTRYLINDACVFEGKVLISGSAMGTEGQLTVYGCGVDGRPCYRCLYPNTNSTEGCKSCSDNGVLGTVPGTIGMLQATETIKVLTGIGVPMYDRLLMYDAMQCSFLSIKKPLSSRVCPVCGPGSEISSMADSSASTVAVRGPSDENGLVSTNARLPPELQISCQEYDQLRKDGSPHVLLDVRVRRQYEMCSLDGAINIPLGELHDNLDRIEDLSAGSKPVYRLCRRGIASAEATLVLAKVLSKGDRPDIHSVRNITGGLNGWCNAVDPSFPKY